MTKQEFDTAYESGYKQGFAAGLLERERIEEKKLKADLHAEHICPSCEYYKGTMCMVCGDFDLFKFKGKENNND